MRLVDSRTGEVIEENYQSEDYQMLPNTRNSKCGPVYCSAENVMEWLGHPCGFDIRPVPDDDSCNCGSNNCIFCVPGN